MLNRVYFPETEYYEKSFILLKTKNKFASSALLILSF